MDKQDTNRMLSKNDKMSQPAKDLDSRLINIINTPGRWDAFHREIIEPLLREPIEQTKSNSFADSIYDTYDQCPAKRNGFPMADPTDTDGRAFSVDRVDPLTLDVGRRHHLTCIALLYHMDAQRRLQAYYGDTRYKENSSPLWHEFDESARERNFFSMTRPIGNRSPVERSTDALSPSPENTPMSAVESTACADLDTNERLWRKGCTFPITHQLASNVSLVNENQLYRWTIYRIGKQGQRVSGLPTSTTNDRERWRMHFAPLQHYAWLTSGSVLGTWYFNVDVNTAFILNWYQNYLAHTNELTETVQRYADAIQRRRNLEKKKTTLLTKFVTDNQAFRQSLRSKELVLAKRTIDERDQYSRYLAALEKLYNEFTRASGRVSS